MLVAALLTSLFAWQFKTALALPVSEVDTMLVTSPKRARECAGHISPQAWEDVCYNPFGTVYYRPSYCPKGTYCAETTTTQPMRHKGSIKIDFTTKVEQIVSVPVLRELDSASVSAQIRSSDGSFVVAVNNAIVGTLRGSNKKTCVYDSRTRECKPNQKYNLQSGNFIDFTFGLRNGQSGNLIYSFLGPNAH
ncbi:hypothetical protein FPRO03_14129 [Fusarium proliferatum]|nr:hypothetical protein FPRO03_14129 [Fusarium proliferatum]